MSKSINEVIHDFATKVVIEDISDRDLFYLEEEFLTFFFSLEDKSQIIREMKKYIKHTDDQSIIDFFELFIGQGF